MIVDLRPKPKFNPLKQCIVCGKLVTDRYSLSNIVRFGYFASWIGVGDYIYCESESCKNCGTLEFFRTLKAQELIDDICKRTGLKRIKSREAL